MRDKIFLFGTSEYSEYVYQTIKIEGEIDVVGFTVDKDHYKEETFNGLPIFVLENLSKEYNMVEYGILITVGYTQMNLLRKKVYNLCKSLGYRVASYVSSRSICDSDQIGEGSIIMPMAYIPPLTEVGKCSVVNIATTIGHTSNIGDFNWFSGNCIMGGNVKVGDNCFFGMNSLLKNGITVESFTMLGAYSYLSNDSVEGRFYSGNPAVNTKNLKSKIVCDFI